MNKQSPITEKLLFICTLLLLAVFVTSCSSDVSDVKTMGDNNQGVAGTSDSAEKSVTTQLIVDYVITISDDARDRPPLMNFPIDVETVIEVKNKKEVTAVFEIPQLNVYEKIEPGQSRVISLRPVKSGFYQMTLNSAGFGTFKVG